MKKIVFLLSCSFSFSIYASDMHLSVEEQIERNDYLWAKATVEKNAAVIAPMMADDFIFIDWDGIHKDAKSEEIKMIKDPQIIYTKMMIDEITVRHVGDTAVAIGKLTMSGTSHGHKFDGQYAFNEVWHSKSGKWLASVEQVTAIRK